MVRGLTLRISMGFFYTCNFAPCVLVKGSHREEIQYLKSKDMV